MFKRKTVDTILAGFQKTVEDLYGLAGDHRRAADEKATRSITLQSEADALRREANRAGDAAARIEKLIAG